MSDEFKSFFHKTLPTKVANRPYSSYANGTLNVLRMEKDKKDCCSVGSKISNLGP